MASSSSDSLAVAISKWLGNEFSLKYYTSIRGAENIHIYLWIAKDLSWALGNLYGGLLFGTLALCWCLVLLANAARLSNTEEVFFMFPTIFWLLGNYMWMYGELVNDDDEVFAPVGADLLVVGIAIVVFYHVILKNFYHHILKADDRTIQSYIDAGLTPRFSYFATWRQYEVLYIHIPSCSLLY